MKTQSYLHELKRDAYMKAIRDIIFSYILFKQTIAFYYLVNSYIYEYSIYSFEAFGNVLIMYWKLIKLLF